MGRPELTLERIAELTGGVVLRGRGDLRLEEVCTDSRRALAPNSLFVALVGERFDGHAFLEHAHKKGARAALVSRDDVDAPEELALVRVDDTLSALQQLAAGWRALFDIPVVGITGSNGKTIVKDMLTGILAQEHTVHRSPGSYNSQIGVPLALLGLRPEHEVAVIEAGISRIGEMERLEEMIRPTHGVLTNIGMAHAAGLHDLETTAREKLKLFGRFEEEPLVFPASSEPLRQQALPGDPLSFGVEAVGNLRPSQAIDNAADFSVVDAVDSDGGFELTVRFPDGERHDFVLHAPGRHNLSNAVAAIAAADRLGASIEAMREGLAAYELSPLRLEMHTTQRGVTLINDAYSSDPVSARAALSVLQDYAGEQRAIAILGDMLDLGARSEAEHRRLGQMVARSDVDHLVCFGDRARHIGRAAIEAGFDDEQVDFADSLGQLHALLERRLQIGDVVLFKASRTMKLERAAERLLESVAPSRLHIDLDAIRNNFHAIRRHVGDGVGFIAVVKSFGYGNDATRVSQTLAREGVDALAVAYADEAIPLRKRGLSLPILVTNALASEADKLVKYELTPLVYSKPVVDALCAQARRHDCTVAVHLEIDTGMNRLGLRPDEAVDFARRIAQLDEIDIEGVMTHFAAADDPAEDDFTREQLCRFEEVVASLKAAGIEPPVIHAANTAAAWRFPEASFDMVRVGLGLYGLSPSPDVDGETDGVRPALSFSTRITHLHQISPGESVGYNRTWRADSQRTIATIAAGYNDGLPRFMSNGGEVLIGGARCPIVGNVCMDVAMVDVTHLEHVRVGDPVVLFGRQGDEAITVDEIASRGGTINYEILCNISPRVRRIFVRQ